MLADDDADELGDGLGGHANENGTAEAGWTDGSGAGAGSHVELKPVLYDMDGVR